MNRNVSTPQLAALDATVPHPGFNPFDGFRRRREIERQLNGMGLDFAQLVAAGMMIKGMTVPGTIQLPEAALALIAEHKGLQA